MLAQDTASGTWEAGWPLPVTNESASALEKMEKEREGDRERMKERGQWPERFYPGGGVRWQEEGQDPGPDSHSGLGDPKAASPCRGEGVVQRRHSLNSNE